MIVDDSFRTHRKNVTLAQVTAYNSNRFVVAAEKGRLMMWPGFLLHAVAAGKCRSDEDRLVIAFNIMIRGTIETTTARLELR